MITRVKGSTFSFKDNTSYISLTDPQIGAVGDGVTDNTTAINLAFTFNIPVFIPPGVFLTAGLILPSGASMFGVGTTSKLKLKTASNVPMLTCLGAIDFYNFQLDANKAGQLGSGLHGIILSNGLGAMIDSVKIINPLGDGININGASTVGVNISQVMISGFVKNGITVEAGIDISLDQCKCFSSDVLASPGDGISLAPTLVGALVAEVSISNCRARNNIGRGLSVLGFGSKNVSDVNVSGGSFSFNTSHGIHAFTSQAVTINGVNVKNNGGDGGRLEGDVQFSRVSECVFNANTGTCLREVTTGATPNNNGLIYNATFGNGSNTVVKVGASSFIV